MSIKSLGRWVAWWSLSWKFKALIFLAAAELAVAQERLTVQGERPNIFFNGTADVLQDWYLFADYFGFRVYDAEGGVHPLTISPGAPKDSLYVDTRAFIGLGTPFPKQKLHLVGELFPSIRLETALPAPYQWDI